MARSTIHQRLGPWLAWACVAALCSAHGYAVWVGMEGRAGLRSAWPIWRDDHPLYFHSALITREFLKTSGTTAGYDPSFMAGYPKSVVFPTSSTLSDLVMAALLSAGCRPALGYKLYVLIGTASIPGLIACAGAAWRLRPWAIAVGVFLFLVDVWTENGINLATYGMVPYLVAIPVGLLATGVFCRYLECGGLGWWLFAASLMVVAVLVHMTSAMIVAPAAALAYSAAVLTGIAGGPRLSATRHLGVWAIPVLVLIGNAFWWLPGLALASTKGSSDFAFVHPEGVLARLWNVVSVEAPIQAVLIVLGLLGWFLLCRHRRAGTAALIGFIGAGFFWGYLAGGFRALDFLQPGRHTFAFYSGLALAAGFGVTDVLAEVDRGAEFRLGRWLILGLILVATRLFAFEVQVLVEYRLGLRGAPPFLTSRAPDRLLWLVDRIERHVRPGERLLYEEGGFGQPGVPDPFLGGRYSGLLAWRTGVEFLGGPYLHASLATNFTQFGEGKLFGRSDWDRAFFERYARLYRPSAIVCWSRKSRAFCLANPDLIHVLDDDGALLIGRVRGFEGATIEGTAEVTTEGGRLHVRHATAGRDGLVVLRYHFVPGLSSAPPLVLEPVRREDDPVPFIGFRPPARDQEYTLRLIP